MNNNDKMDDEIKGVKKIVPGKHVIKNMDDKNVKTKIRLSEKLKNKLILPAGGK